jgi:hypothetical protein
MSDTIKITTFDEFGEYFTGIKLKELQEYCKKHKVKKYRSGRAKWVLLTNIFEHIFKRQADYYTELGPIMCMI